MDDALADGNRFYIVLTAPAISTDPDYNGINPSDVSAINIDDETHMVEAGRQHTVAVKTDGTLWAWGDNIYGQLGKQLGKQLRMAFRLIINGRKVKEQNFM